jgi:hypothetical protein
VDRDSQFLHRAAQAGIGGNAAADED